MSAQKSVNQQNAQKRPRRRNRNRKGKKSASAQGMGWTQAGWLGTPTPKPRKRRSRRRGPLTKRQPTGGSEFARGRNRKQMRITESEFIGAVVVANQPNFNVVQYDVNPGQVGTFPWLSTIAKQFEKYRFEKLEFIFKREVSEFATAGQTGKIIMSFDTDAADPAPASKQQMEDTDPHCDAMPCENLTFPIRRDILGGPSVISKFVRPGGFPARTDPKTYDIGNLFVATQGIASNTEIGELHVRYTVVLEKPVLESNDGTLPNNSVAMFVLQNQSLNTSGVSGVMPFTPASQVVNGLGITIGPNNGTFNLPAGNYNIDFSGDMDITSAGASTGYIFTINGMVNGADVNPFISQSQQQTATGTIVGHSAVSLNYFVSSNGSSTFQLAYVATYPNGVVDADCVIRFTLV